MPSFAVNPGRLDPYKNFKFRVRWDGQYIANVSHISALRRATQRVPFREGGSPSFPNLSPGPSSFEPLTLERGLTHDTAFEDWADQVFNPDGDNAVSLRNLRKDIRIELFNLSGQLVLAYDVYRCWVSEYQALPDLDANGEAVPAIERLVLQHEGWRRDKEVREPEEK